MNSRFSISVKDVRAIKEAEIALNGITVLAGENGCGKSTVSKLLYGFIKTSINFDSVISDLYSRELTFSSSLLRDFIPKKKEYNLFSDIEDSDLFESYNAVPRISDSVNSENYISDIILPRIEIIRKNYEKQDYSITNIAFTRLLQLYERHVRKLDAKNPIELLNDYDAYMRKLLQEISELKMTHNLKVFNFQLAKYFNEITDKWNYSFKEYDSNLIDKRNKSVTLQKSFSEVFYVDVPTVFDNDTYRMPSRVSIIDDLRTGLRTVRGGGANESISAIIEDALNGKISRKDDMFSRIFVYTAKNGQSIPLSQAASGLKCFAVLERLYANGCLGEDTLLIVDEPEVHLHPKWIVEYARVLVLIQKYLHTTIMVASHNPDMVSAIKYISEREEIADSLIFYIAEEIDSEGFGKFKYKNLGTDIDEIFSSFNVALDRINLYGFSDGE